jgi:hypothetical protein
MNFNWIMIGITGTLAFKGLELVIENSWIAGIAITTLYALWGALATKSGPIRRKKP